MTSLHGDPGRPVGRRDPSSRSGDRSRLPDPAQHPGYAIRRNAFNTAQAQGFDSNGNPGLSNFFTVSPATGASSPGISVAITNPALVAISSDGSAGSNGNVANLSATLTTALPAGPDRGSGAYASLVFNVGNDTSNASTESSAIGQNLLALTNQQSTVSGVNIDEETTNLIRYQTAVPGRGANHQYGSATQHHHARHGFEPELLNDMRVNPNLVPTYSRRPAAEPVDAQCGSAAGSVDRQKRQCAIRQPFCLRIHGAEHHRDRTTSINTLRT